jgi:hypothetical protein
MRFAGLCPRDLRTVVDHVVCVDDDSRDDTAARALAVRARRRGCFRAVCSAEF